MEPPSPADHPETSRVGKVQPILPRFPLAMVRHDADGIPRDMHGSDPAGRMTIEGRRGLERGDRTADTPRPGREAPGQGAAAT